MRHIVNGYRYIRIHPFEDGNGRIARLMRDNPGITYAQLTTDLGINTSAVQKLVKRMTDNGYIARLEKLLMASNRHIDCVKISLFCKNFF